MIDGRGSLMFFVPGATNVVRMNGVAAWITAEADVRARFGRQGRLPRSVIVIEIAEAYFQCARAINRAQLWAGVPPGAGGGDVRRD